MKTTFKFRAARMAAISSIGSANNQNGRRDGMMDISR